MRSVLSLVFPAVALSAVLAACGGGQPAPATPGAEPAASASSAAAVPTVWSDSMTMEQKSAFMKARVVPSMAPVFKAADPKEFAEVECKTCHGPEYKEPKEFLPKLTMKDGKITSFAEKPEISKIMAEKVVPEMAKAMGLPPYDPATHQGFGCGGCHAIEMK
jgi:cytochrome c553